MHHITLDTGHVRWSPRSEVSDDLMRLLLDHLQASLRARAPVPGRPGWLANSSQEHNTIITSVWRELRDVTVPVISFLVAPDLAAVRAGWRILRGGEASIAEEPTVPMDSGPWLLVRLYRTASLLPPEDLNWLGDYERCMAWAWLEGPTAAGVH